MEAFDDGTIHGVWRWRGLESRSHVWFGMECDDEVDEIYELVAWDTVLCINVVVGCRRSN